MSHLGNEVKNLIILGGGGHAKSIVAVLQGLPQFNLMGYCDKADRGSLVGVPFLGTEETIDTLAPNVGLVLGLSYLKSPVDMSLRASLIRRFEGAFMFPVISSAQAILAPEVKVGNGSVLLHRCVVNSDARLGKFCVVNTNAVIEHDCVIDDNVSISPGAIVCGGCRIGANTYVGAGAVIRDGVSIVDGVTIGCGSNVVQSIQAPGVYFGNPARKVFHGSENT